MRLWWSIWQPWDAGYACVATIKRPFIGGCFLGFVNNQTEVSTERVEHVVSAIGQVRKGMLVWSHLWSLPMVAHSEKEVVILSENYNPCYSSYIITNITI